MKRLMFWPVLLMVTATASAADIPNANSADAEVYATHCTACHTLPHPGRLDWQGWRNMLYLMEKRMDERAMNKPTGEQWQAIARYLKAHAR